MKATWGEFWITVLAGLMLGTALWIIVGSPRV